MNTDRSNKLQLHKILSMLITFTGLLLLIFMVVVEDEPGALPLALILAGAGWFFYTKSQIRSLRNSP